MEAEYWEKQEFLGLLWKSRNREHTHGRETLPWVGGDRTHHRRGAPCHGSGFDTGVHCLQGDRGTVGGKSQHVSMSQQAQLLRLIWSLTSTNHSSSSHPAP